MVLQTVILLIGSLVNAIIKDLTQPERKIEDKDLLKELDESLDGIKSLVDPKFWGNPTAVRRRLRRLRYAAEDVQSILGPRRSTVIALRYSVDYLNRTLLVRGTDQGSGISNQLPPVGSFFDGVESILQNEHLRSSDPMRRTLLGLQESVSALTNTRRGGQERATGSRPARRSIHQLFSHVQDEDFSSTHPYRDGARVRGHSMPPNHHHRTTRSTSLPSSNPRRSARERSSQQLEDFSSTRAYHGGL